MTETTQKYLETLRQNIESALDLATQFSGDCPARLREAIRYSLLAPGKRLRPILVLSACELCSDPSFQQHAMPAACAVEMIHAYSLIHDDLPAMDNDDLRRGLPTCHRKFDEATAILAGDALLALAFEMIGTIMPPKRAGWCCRELAIAAGACRLVGGQMDDMFHKNKSDDVESAIKFMEHIHHRKTGTLIRASLKLGGMVAGASSQQLVALDHFGMYFGLVFQITDDLLDVLGEEKTAGKRLRKDKEMNKVTYPLLLGIECAKQAAEDAVKAALKELTFFDPFDQAVAEEPLPLKVLRELLNQLPNRTK